MKAKKINTLEDFERHLMIKSETRGLPNVPSAREVGIVAQRWVTEDKGEGGTVDDGFSLHQSEDDCTAFIKEHQQEHSEILEHEYSKPSGDPFLAMISHELFVHVENSKYGIRIYDDTVFPG